MSDNNMTFEEAMAAIENKIKEMESGALPLAGSVKAYEECNALLKYCNELLEGYQKRIETVGGNSNDI